VSVIGNIGNTVGSIGKGVGKLLTPTKKSVKSEQKNFIQETPEEYAQRLMMRRSRRH
jgi:hypothetical protein